MRHFSNISIATLLGFLCLRLMWLKAWEVRLAIYRCQSAWTSDSSFMRIGLTGFGILPIEKGFCAVQRHCSRQKAEKNQLITGETKNRLMEL